MSQCRAAQRHGLKTPQSDAGAGRRCHGNCCTAMGRPVLRAMAPLLCLRIRGAAATQASVTRVRTMCHMKAVHREGAGIDNIMVPAQTLREILLADARAIAWGSCCELLPQRETAAASAWLWRLSDHRYWRILVEPLHIPLAMVSAIFQHPDTGPGLISSCHLRWRYLQHVESCHRPGVRHSLECSNGCSGCKPLAAARRLSGAGRGVCCAQGA